MANNNSGNVSVLFRNGDDTFQVAVMYGAGLAPKSIAVADFNGDGQSDLVVANEGSNDVSVLLASATVLSVPPSVMLWEKVLKPLQFLDPWQWATSTVTASLT